MANETRFDRTTDILLWLFPATYLLHIAEEYWGGGGYSAYVARTKGISLAPSRFLLLNGIGLALMILGVVLSRRYGFSRWLMVCLGMVALGNGVTHTINGVAARSYNPGLLSGLLVWIPLGLATLVFVKGRMTARKYWTALGIGIGILGVVTLLTLSGGKPLSFLSR